MRISYTWLKEYVDVTVPAEKLAEVLTMAGLSVESVTKLGDDHLIEIEITANRPDWLSVIGVAREVAALACGRLKLPTHSPTMSALPKPGVSISVDEKALCARYTARVIRNVRIGESPAWLKARLEAMGLRPVNNVVDITNFCLFETGEPMHAFDLDRIAGEAVIIRKARKGEKIVVIDGAEKALDETMLVIADAGKPIAVAGVMGGLNTEVTSATKNILLEAAYFDPVSIRRTAKKLATSTESSYRFERRVDIQNIVRASDRALGLIRELAGGEPAELIDVATELPKQPHIFLRFARLSKVLGASPAPERIQNIVASLGMKILHAAHDGLELEAPSFRHDLKAEIDVIEEVARIHGYGAIPTTLPNIVEQPVRMEPEMVGRDRVREILASTGCDEIITYSLTGKRTIAAAGLDAGAAVEICNPLTSEQEAMRVSLVSGILGAVAWNINRKSKDLRLFELGNVYMKKPHAEYGERRNLSIAITGQAFSSWAGASREANFFELKGIVETLITELGVTGVSYAPGKRPYLISSTCAELMIDGKPAGALGEVSRKVLDAFDIKEKVFVFEADADLIVERSSPARSFSELPKYPAVSRDISLVASRRTPNADIIDAIRASAGPTLKDVRLIDRYTGKQIPEDKVSLTYRLEYQDPARTLEERDVTATHERVLRSLDEKFGAKLR